MARKKPVPHLGTSQLHCRHSVLIEPGPIPRARVMDQALHDRYLMDDLITPGQHRAADRVYTLASTSGVYVTGQNYSPKVKSPAKSSSPLRASGLGRIMLAVRNGLSREHERVLFGVVCRACDVSGNAESLERLRQALSFIETHYTGSRSDPLALLQMSRKGKGR